MKRYIGEVWEGPEGRSFCPQGVEGYQPPCPWMCSPTWKLPELHNIGICIEASSSRYDQLLTPFPATLPSLKKCVFVYVGGGAAENLKLLVTAPSFW